MLWRLNFWRGRMRNMLLWSKKRGKKNCHVIIFIWNSLGWNVSAQVQPPATFFCFVAASSVQQHACFAYHKVRAHTHAHTCQILAYSSELYLNDSALVEGAKNETNNRNLDWTWYFFESHYYFYYCYIANIEIDLFFCCWLAAASLHTVKTGQECDRQHNNNKKRALHSRDTY